AAQLLRLPNTSRPRPDKRAARLHGSKHSLERDRQAISYHYDLSNDFFALWLDRRMVYTCAYFTSLEDSLEAAQERKLDYICRKLRLRPGESLLESRLWLGWTCPVRRPKLRRSGDRCHTEPSASGMGPAAHPRGWAARSLSGRVSRLPRGGRVEGV